MRPTLRRPTVGAGAPSFCISERYENSLSKIMRARFCVKSTKTFWEGGVECSYVPGARSFSACMHVFRKSLPELL